MRTLTKCFVLSLVVLFSGILSGDSAKPDQIVRKTERSADAAQKIAANYLRGNFEPSLEMKECADFLLTPALIVQELLSDGSIVTYPTE